MVREMSDRGNVSLGKFSVVEVSVREVSGRRIVHLGEYPSGKCPSGKCQSGIYPRGSVSRRTAQSGNCPHITLDKRFKDSNEITIKNRAPVVLLNHPTRTSDE